MINLILHYIILVGIWLVIYGLITGLIFLMILVLTCHDIEDVLKDRAWTAQVILWPLTTVIYIIIFIIRCIRWIFKNAWDVIILGYWDFIKSIPKRSRLEDEEDNVY